MSPEAQRIAIAEACVGTFVCCRCRESRSTILKFRAPFCSDTCAEGVSDYTLDDAQEAWPDYLSDLNAMHEALTILTAEQRAIYAVLLASNSNGIIMEVDEDLLDSARSIGTQWSNFALIKLAFADAQQCAGAFLRAIGKWDDSK